MRTPAGVLPSENAGMNNSKDRRHGRHAKTRLRTVELPASLTAAAKASVFAEALPDMMAVKKLRRTGRCSRQRIAFKPFFKTE
jgi:hypothetical protein